MSSIFLTQSTISSDVDVNTLNLKLKVGPLISDVLSHFKMQMCRGNTTRSVSLLGYKLSPPTHRTSDKETPKLEQT